jgi:sec-independent protein translocase protein TatC
MGQEFSQLATMTLSEHLEELRFRLLIAVLTTLLFSTVIGVFFGVRLVEMAIEPAIMSGVSIETDFPTEYLGVVIRISLTMGIVLALPVWLYQISRWAAPALTRYEQRLSCLAILIALPLLCLSIPVAIVFILPLAIRAFGSGTSLTITPSWQLIAYFGLISRIMIGTAAVFEVPLIRVIL